MLKTVYINGRPLSNYGLYISGPGVYNAPGRRYEAAEIPGRNGALVVTDGTYEQIEVTYSYYIKSDIKSNLDAIKEILYKTASGGIFRLTDDYNTDTYREAYFIGPFATDPGWAHKWTSGEITFLCSPERYLIRDPVTIAAGDSRVMENPEKAGGLYRAKPIFTITGAGVVRVAGSDINILSLPESGEILLDTNGRFATDGNGTLCNSCLGRIGYWPELQGGETIRNDTGGPLTVEERWWVL